MKNTRVLHNAFFRLDLTVTKAEGSFLWDENGKKYIDFTSGWNVANLGWNHPEVNEALRAQAAKNVYVPMWTTDPAQVAYSEGLADALPKKLNKFVRATGGTEANEMALKIARVATGRKKLLGFFDTYHGHSFEILSFSRKPESVEKVAPLVPENIQLAYPSTNRSGKDEEKTLAEFLNELEDTLSDKDVAALITEPGIVTGWGDVSVAPPGYLTEVRNLTQKYGTLLIVDEVGTGFSRCGTLFGIERESVVPDLMTFAKGASNGAAAIGVVAGPKEMLEGALANANLTSTFGWTSAACAAAAKTLEIHRRDVVWEQAAKKGEHLQDRLTRELTDHPAIKTVRGLGLEIGIEFTDSEKLQQTLSDCLKKGLHLIGKGTVIQLMPPLTMEEKTLKEGTDILIEVIKNT